MTDELKLDLGSGPRPAAGYVGVDLCGTVRMPLAYTGARSLPLLQPGDVLQLDLVSGKDWPFESGSVAAARSSHFIEHIAEGPVAGLVPAKDGLFFFFDELERVMAPGAECELSWPAVEPPLCMSFQDPTHRRHMSRTVLHYLTGEGRATMGVDHYNVRCNFEILRLVEGRTAERYLVEYRAMLRKRG